MPIEQRMVRHELVRRKLHVVRTSTPAPGIVRVTLGGGELAGFASDGPADHVKLFFAETPLFEASRRDFTPLAYRPGEGDSGGELDLDFVLHGDNGPASAWASAATVGDELNLGGPRGSRLAPTGLGRLILVVDETAYPAASRWLAAIDESTRATVIATSDISFEEYLGADRAAAADIVQVGADGDALAELQRLEPFDDSTLFFLAGEAGGLVPLRRHLKSTLALPADQVQASGYWKRGVVGLDHHAPLDPSDPD